MYKKPYKVEYHVFSNGVDEYTGSYKEARLIAKDFKEEFGCYRIYKNTLWNGKAGVFEECIISYGDYPS